MNFLLEFEKLCAIIDEKKKEIEKKNKIEMDNQKRFYNQKIIGNNLLKFAKDIEIYQYEIRTIEKFNMFWINWEYYQELILEPKDMKWRIIPICACAPSNKPENMMWITNCERFIPNIYNFVKSLKNVRSAIISRMGKNVKLKVHQGWADVANYILRCQLPIIVEKEKSGLIVNGELVYHNPKKYILFDDSMNHTGFNESEKDRFILIVDFKRPKEAMKGISKITIDFDLDELKEKFIKINNYYGNLKLS
jgi:hypothetical protein